MTKAVEMGNNYCVIKSGNDYVLQSYNSIVAKKEGDKLVLGKDWDYSKTTLKQLYSFMEKYGVGCRATTDKVITARNKKAAVYKAFEDGSILYDESMV